MSPGRTLPRIAFRLAEAAGGVHYFCDVLDASFEHAQG
jgi:hypothetical protein